MDFTRHRGLASLFGLGLLAAAASASAASVSTFSLAQPSPDSLAFVVDSVAASSSSGPFSRYRISNSASTSMATDVLPNSNLVATGSLLWFTTRFSPYRIGRADLSTLSGTPVYYTPSGISAPFDDMVLGGDGNLWAANAQSGRVTRTTQDGASTSFTGNGTIHPVGIAAGPDGNVWFVDAVNRRITRINVNTNVFTDIPVPQVSAGSIPQRIASSPDGSLWVATQDGFARVNALTLAVQMTYTGPQTPRRLAVGPDGTLWMTTGDQYVTQFTTSGNVARLKLFTNTESVSAGLYIDPLGDVYVSDSREADLARIRPAASTVPDTTVVEFYNSTLNHYFITANAIEATGIDNGTAGPGWTRTGQTWKAWVNGPIPGAAEVCRFYGSTDINPATGLRRGPNSHFYTSEPAECAAVKQDSGWTYEGLARFWTIKPTPGCPASTQPVYRVYNHRFAFNDSNHRYAVSTAIYNQMLGLGWTGEGVVMCAPL